MCIRMQCMQVHEIYYHIFAVARMRAQCALMMMRTLASAVHSLQPRPACVPEYTGPPLHLHACPLSLSLSLYLTLQ